MRRMLRRAAAPEARMCPERNDLVKTVRSLQFAGYIEPEMCVHERHADVRWLVTRLAELFSSGDILRNRRR